MSNIGSKFGIHMLTVVPEIAGINDLDKQERYFCFGLTLFDQMKDLYFNLFTKCHIYPADFIPFEVRLLRFCLELLNFREVELHCVLRAKKNRHFWVGMKVCFNEMSVNIDCQEIDDNEGFFVYRRCVELLPKAEKPQQTMYFWRFEAKLLKNQGSFVTPRIEEVRKAFEFEMPFDQRERAMKEGLTESKKSHKLKQNICSHGIYSKTIIFLIF